MFNFQRRDAAHIEAETVSTPLEVAESPKAWRQLFGDRLPLEGCRVRPFMRRDIAPGIRLYSAGQGASTLIVGFAGKQNRLKMPVAMFLQHLDEACYDLLLLTDPDTAHYDRGIAGFASSLYDLSNKLADLGRALGYSRLVTYGTSMGGFAALRAGGMMGAARAISVGGRYAWDIGRLQQGQPLTSSFDPICACRPPYLTEAYVLYSKAMAADAGSAAVLKAILPDCNDIAMPDSRHNFLHVLYRNGLLADFHKQIFNLDSKPQASGLQALLAIE